MQKLAQAVSAQNTPAPRTAVAQLENWIALYGFFAASKAENGPQDVANIFAAIYGGADSEPITASKKHSQTYGQTDNFDKTLAARLQHFKNEQQTSRDTNMQLSISGSDAQVYRTTVTSLFKLIRRREQCGTLVRETTQALEKKQFFLQSQAGLEDLQNLKILKQRETRAMQKARDLYHQ